MTRETAGMGLGWMWELPPFIPVAPAGVPRVRGSLLFFTENEALSFGSGSQHHEAEAVL